MGSWGANVFDNDAAADFLAEAEAAPADAVGRQLRAVVDTPAGEWLDVDDGSAGWAACELVAMALGHGDDGASDETAGELAARLTPTEADRQLALRALERIGDRATSELVALWADEADGGQLPARLQRLRARLEAARVPVARLPKPQAGDVLVLPAAAGSSEVIVMQVVNAAELALFAGSCSDATAAIDHLKSALAWRVRAPVARLLRHARVVGKLPLRKDLRGTKLYASEAGAIEHYMVAPAKVTVREAKIVSYEEARGYDVARAHDEESLRRIALAHERPAPLRTPDEREAELRAREAARWAARRACSTPGPFGDLAAVDALLRWIAETGVDNVVQRYYEQSIGAIGYGRPNEDSERGAYAFAALVALWRGGALRDEWPASAGAPPPPPPPQSMVSALAAARYAADHVLTREAELRLIWSEADDGGAALRAHVAALQAALA